MVLGVGAFGVVSEITRIELRPGKNDFNSSSSDSITVTSAVERQDPEEFPQDTKGAADDSREIAAKRCLRAGQARYAIKQLNSKLTNLDAASGRIDLAIEIKLLHVLSHPNIVKMRGVFESGDPFHPEYFFIMDRLYGTLEERLRHWKQQQDRPWKGML